MNDKEEVERIVLGCMMVETGITPIVLSYGISEDYFDAKRHKIIFQTIKSIYNSDNKNIPVDIISVTTGLRKEKKLEEAGGAYYIASLASKAISSSNIEYYVMILIEEYLNRQVTQLGHKILNYTEKEKKDPFEIIEEIDTELLNILNKIKRKKTVKIYDSAKNFLLADKKNNHEISSGFISLDKMIGGFRSGELIIVAGRPSMGKTSFAISSAVNIAKKNNPCIIFSLEMAIEQITAKIISILTDIPSNKILRRKLNDSEVFSILEVHEKIKDVKLFIDDTPAISLNELRAKCKRLKMSEDIKVVFVDYLQLINSDDYRKNTTREQEISKISRTLKSIAKELDVCVVALSQLNRNLERREDKEPRLSDLRESGAIEQDADIVIFIHRPEYYKITEIENIGNTENMAEIIVAKNRNGSVGETWMRFDKRITKFSDIDLNNIINNNDNDDNNDDEF